MLAMSFIFSGVLWAAAAVVAPIVIHLLLRTRPRTVTLPTMQFVHKTHRASISRHRLKHIILLAMRMLALLLIVFIVARAFLPAYRASAAQQTPTALVVVVDNSASMGYRLRGQSLLQRGRQEAADIVASLGGGSQVAVHTADGRGGYPAFMADLGFAVEQIQDVRAGEGGRSIAHAVGQAIDQAREAELPRREVLVVTDNTARAWAGLADADTEGVAVAVLDVGVVPDANFALGDIQLSATSLPVGAGLTLQTTVGGDHVGGEVVLDARLGRSQKRQQLTVALGQPRRVRLEFQPMQEGTLGGEVRLEPEDPLAADNIRYFTVEVAPAASILVVTGPAPEDPTGRLMADAVAPRLPGGGGGLVRRRVASETLTAADLDGASLVLLANADALRETQWQAVERWVRKGGALWAVPGSLTNPAAWNTPAAQKVLPARLGARQTLSPPRRFASPDTTEPMLRGFADEANPPLTDVSIDQRFALASLAGDARVVLADDAGEPLILTRRIGSGRVVLWATSPARGWSDLARLAGQFVVLVRDTTDALLGAGDRATQYTWGSEVLLDLPPGVDAPMVRVHAPGEPEPRMIEANLRQGVVAISADRIGHYTAEFTRGMSMMTRGFSVNVPLAESDLRPVDPDRLAEAFGESLLVVSSADERATQLGRAEAPLNLLPILLIALVAVLIGESYFSNRFYRRPPQTAGEEAQASTKV